MAQIILRGSTCWIAVLKFLLIFLGQIALVPQAVLFLPREEGGQDLVHLPSRHATFHLQFIQKFLTGPVDLVLRKMAKIILHTVDGLGPDDALFLLDAKQLCLAGVPQIYSGLFKVWQLLKVCRLEATNSLYWLLQELRIKGARLDVAGENVPGLTQIL